MNIFKKIGIGLLVAFIILMIYDRLLFHDIPPKTDPKHIRIGFINLHEAQIEADELQHLQSNNCDIWLFLEWNGNNLDQVPEFSKQYVNVYEKQDMNTFGTLVLSKDSTVRIKEIGANGRPYTCDYPKHLISYPDLNIYLAHAPPPLPKCNYETENYISDLILDVGATEAKSNLIVGDLNTLPFQSNITNLKELDYVDAYKQTNSLPIGTFAPWSWFPRVLKLDYVFYKGNIEPIIVERFSLKSSDHCGYIADFKVERTD
jgi:endonuclease/exonuclease/phosphatase (EEP) superfamily protein YafD